jgi:hypothetical protein
MVGGLCYVLCQDISAPSSPLEWSDLQGRAVLGISISLLRFFFSLYSSPLEALLSILSNSIAACTLLAHYDWVY